MKLLISISNADKTQSVLNKLSKEVQDFLADHPEYQERFIKSWHSHNVQDFINVLREILPRTIT